MQVNESYDLIVIGNQLSGYFLATAAAQRGKNVLLIESKSRESVVFERPSGHFLADMFWEPVIGLCGGSAVDQFLRGLGVYQNLDDIFREFKPAVQLVSPESRVDFQYKLGAMNEEWEREFPKEAPGLKELGDRLSPGKGIAGDFQRLVEQVGLESQWVQLGDIQPPLYGSASPENVSLELMSYYVKNCANSVRYTVGGKDALKEILTSRLKWYGGKVKRDARVEEIIFERGKLAGALLSSFEGFVRSKMVVGNMHAAGFLGLVPERFRTEALKREVNALRSRYWRLNFTVKVPEQLVPEGMGNHVCYHELDSTLDEGQFLQLFVLPQGAYSGVRAGEKVLLLRALLPLEAKTIRPDFLAVTIRRCLKRLENFIPFLDDKERVVIPNPDALANDWVYRSHFNFSRVEDIPTDLLVYGSTFDPKCMEGVTANWGRFGLKGLALCSRDVAPAHGVLGEIETAMRLLDELFASPAST